MVTRSLLLKQQTHTVELRLQLFISLPLDIQFVRELLVDRTFDGHLFCDNALNDLLNRYRNFTNHFHFLDNRLFDYLLHGHRHPDLHRHLDFLDDDTLNDHLLLNGDFLILDYNTLDRNFNDALLDYNLLDFDNNLPDDDFLNRYLNIFLNVLVHHHLYLLLDNSFYFYLNFLVNDSVNKNLFRDNSLHNLLDGHLHGNFLDDNLLNRHHNFLGHNLFNILDSDFGRGCLGSPLRLNSILFELNRLLGLWRRLRG
mmetsp:Transcript_21965/g.35224  ORF Transcript_21965/g.35224 Transcript_21965/m.35224 type:complete len:255 (-) Transcript_21965:657-1421(-)